MYGKKDQIRQRDPLATSIADALAAGWSVQRYAQNAGPELEELTITGSHIVRRDLEASRPIQTIDSENLSRR